MNELLLIQYLTHNCSPEEIKLIDQWIATDKANADWLFKMERIWSLKDELRFSDKQEIEVAYNRFLAGLTKEERSERKKIHLKRTIVLKYAAAIVVVTLLSLNLYKLSDRDVNTNTIEVPNGQRVSLVLSDGTRVWLNSRTTFTYPSRFSSKNREVSLNGEAFFEVAHNEKSPFLVSASLLKVKVLGTQFNMKSYPKESTVVTLAEGKVEVSTNDNENKLTLKPREQVSYTTNSGMVLEKNVNTHITKSWTNGEAAFINKRLNEIICDLNRKFDVEIIITDLSLSKEVFTCHFKESATIEQVLNLLKETRKIDYQMREQKIWICKPQ